MTQTRITVTDEMVQRYMAGASPLAAALGWGTEPTEDRKRIIRTGLEAALGPLLERRKGERRALGLHPRAEASPEVPTCEHDWGLRSKCGPDERWECRTCGHQRALVEGRWFSWMPDRPAEVMAGSDTGTGRAGHKQTPSGPWTSAMDGDR